MKIDRAEAKRIADLAHLAFEDDGLDRMAAELTKILTYIDQLAEFDIPQPQALSPKPSTPLRDDEPRASVDRDQVAGNAPCWNDGYFVVPKVIGGE